MRQVHRLFQTDVCLSVHRCICVEKKKPTRCHWMLYCIYNTHNMFRALLCPSLGARECMCVIIACGVQCLVASCRGSGAGQQTVRPGRGMVMLISQSIICRIWCVFVRASLRIRREENPTRCHWIVYCTYNMLNMFRAFYAHHQELEIICVLLPPVVCSAWLLVVGGEVQSSRLCVQEEGCCMTESCNILLPRRIACCLAPDPRQPTTKHCTP